MKILIVGAGGVGGYFGARLTNAGADVTFLLREARHQKIQSQGLTVETPKETFTVQVKSVTKDQLTPEYDLIMLAPKAYDLQDALASIAGASSKGVLIPFLNGLNHLPLLDERFGRDRVMGGVAQIAGTITPSGSVKQLNDLATLTIGPRSEAHVDMAKAFFARCQQAQFASIYSENIEQSLWDKWVYLASLAGMTTLFRGSVGEIVATPWGTELMTKCFAETCAVASAHGFAMSGVAHAKALENLTKAGSNFTASMLRDLRAGNMTEHEHILGGMVSRALDKNIACDLLKAAYTQLCVAQAQRKT